MALRAVSSRNGITERFGSGEAVFFKDGLRRRRLGVREEGESGVFVGGGFQHDDRLQQRSVLILWNFPGVAGGEGRRVNERFREDADLRAARLDELSRLGNIFTKDEFRFYLFVEARVLERFDCRTAVGRVVRIGDGDFLDGSVEERLPAGFIGIEFGFGGRPEDDAADGVGIGGVGEDEAGFIELARIVAVGREEKVERCAVLDLREKVPARAEGEVEFYTGLFFVGGGDVGEGGFEVGGGGDV